MFTFLCCSVFTSPPQPILTPVQGHWDLSSPLTAPPRPSQSLLLQPHPWHQGSVRLPPGLAWHDSAGKCSLFSPGEDQSNGEDRTFPLCNGRTKAASVSSSVNGSHKELLVPCTHTEMTKSSTGERFLS